MTITTSIKAKMITLKDGVPRTHRVVLSRDDHEETILESSAYLVEGQSIIITAEAAEPEFFGIARDDSARSVRVSIRSRAEVLGRIDPGKPKYQHNRYLVKFTGNMKVHREEEQKTSG